jgi:hypothetical protein
MTRMTRTRAGQMTAPKSCATAERFLPPACEAGGWGRRSGGCHGLGTQTIFYFLKICIQAQMQLLCCTMTFYSLPFTPERPEATEARLEKIYEAAKFGLKGDSLALASGLTPSQYRRLHEFDPLVEMAEMKGRAEGEYVAAKTLHTAAADGDSKAALEILKHQHGWVAKQQIDVNVDQQISVIGALERAQTRVIEGLYTEVPSLETDNGKQTVTELLHTASSGFDAGRDERNPVPQEQSGQ